jgi:hypothetical protein
MKSAQKAEKRINKARRLVKSPISRSVVNAMEQWQQLQIDQVTL